MRLFSHFFALLVFCLFADAKPAQPSLANLFSYALVPGQQAIFAFKVKSKGLAHHIAKNDYKNLRVLLQFPRQRPVGISDYKIKKVDGLDYTLEFTIPSNLKFVESSLNGELRLERRSRLFGRMIHRTIGRHSVTINNLPLFAPALNRATLDTLQAMKKHGISPTVGEIDKATEIFAKYLESPSRDNPRSEEIDLAKLEEPIGQMVSVFDNPSNLMTEHIAHVYPHDAQMQLPDEKFDVIDMSDLGVDVSGVSIMQSLATYIDPLTGQRRLRSVQYKRSDRKVTECYEFVPVERSYVIPQRKERFWDL